MGLFSKWTEYRQNREEKRISRNIKILKNSKAIKDDRKMALDFFTNHDTLEIAVPALLQRFEYSLEHGINDTREKEACQKGVERFEEGAIPYVKEHLQKTSKIAWLIKILKNIGSEQDVFEALYSCLEFGDVSFEQQKVDKNYDILCHLVDYQLGNKLESLYPFLEDHDERVRFATIELLVEQDNPEVPKKISHFLKDDSAENTRIRQTTMEAFVSNKWPIDTGDEELMTALQGKVQVKDGHLAPL